MDFQPSPRAERLERDLRELAEAEVAGVVAPLDADAEFGWEIWNALAHRGSMGLLISQRAGGSGASLEDAVAAFIGFARGGGDLGTASAWATHLAATRALEDFGDPTVSAEILAEAATGAAILAAPAGPAVDPHGPNFAPARALARDHVWVLSGELPWIENAIVASHFIIPASLTATDRAPSGRPSAVLVDKTRHGVFVAGKILKIGERTAGTGTLHLNDVEIPQGRALGPRGQGLERVLVPLLTLARLLGAGAWAGALGRAAARLATHPNAPFGDPRAVPAAAARARGLALLARRLAWRMEHGEVPVGDVARVRRLASRFGLETAGALLEAEGHAGSRFGGAAERMARDALWTRSLDDPGGLLDRALTLGPEPT